jgi:hypothetical protein
MRPILRLRLTIFATVIGFFTLALYTTLVEDILFKGVAFCNATVLQLALKTMGMMTAGLVTGFLTSLLVLQENYYANVILSLAVIIKIFLWVGCESMGSPFWYDALLGSSLLSGLWAGYYAGVKFPLTPA